MPFVKRRRLPVYASILFVSIAFLVWVIKSPTSLSAAATKRTDTAIPVTATIVSPMDLPVYLTGVGSVAPLYDVTVRSQVDGQITKVHFKEGQQVREGDVLIEIDQRTFQAQADQAAARLERDRATLANAGLELQRQRQLSNVSATSTQALEAQKARVEELSAEIRGDKAALQDAQVSVDYTTVRAPITGRIGFRLVDQGNIVKANDTALLTLVTTAPITIIYSESQDALPAIQAALRRGSNDVIAMSTDGTAVLAHGHLEAIGNHVDASSGVVRMKAVFENSDSTLWPGQSVMVRTVVDVLRRATVVPEDAIQIGPDGTFVYVIQAGDTVAIRPVTVSHRVLGYAAVASGLQSGERVVVQGQYRLQDGARVAVTMGPAGTSELRADATDDVPHDLDSGRGTAMTDVH